MNKTNNRYKQFAEVYTSNGNNATEAYLSISPTVTRKTAEVEGSRYLGKPEVVKLIKKIQLDDSERNQITRDSILSELEEMKARNLKKDDRLVIEAMKEECKILGLYSPEQRVNLNRAVGAVEEKRKEAVRGAIKYLVNKAIKEQKPLTHPSRT